MDLTQAPPYAILSHTWGNDEVTLQDFTSPDRESVRLLAGFSKIELICRQALKDELPYSWVDTCCIDKTSSAELSEAINSMYEWYKASVVCYVFLPDLAPEDPVVLDEKHQLENLSIDDGDEGSKKQKKREPSTQFAALRWFRRGWTLQELIAPSSVRFYDAAWTLRGTKTSLAHAISVITGIEEPVLHGHKPLDKIPIARRMSWAAGRTTTRVEDVAYCLLGIFDVNMPMLYGEGSRAFIRLQEEIMHESNDLTLFAWCASSYSNPQHYRGILALSPQEFANCGSIKMGNDSILDTEFTLTNKGIRIKTRLELESGNPMLLLNCKSGDSPVGIYLRQHGASVYARAKPETLALEWIERKPMASEPQTIYISKKVSPTLSAFVSGAHRHGIYLRGGFKFTGLTGVRGDNGSGPAMTVSWVYPSEQWDVVRSLFLTGGGGTFTGVLIAGLSGTTVNIVVGVDMGTPWISFVDNGHPAFQKLLGNGALRNLKGMNDVGKQLNLKRFKGYTVDITEDVVDEEIVFCVDIAKEEGKKEIQSTEDQNTGNPKS